MIPTAEQILSKSNKISPELYSDNIAYSKLIQNISTAKSSSKPHNVHFMNYSTQLNSQKGTDRARNFSLQDSVSRAREGEISPELSKCRNLTCKIRSTIIAKQCVIKFANANTMKLKECGELRYEISKGSNVFEVNIIKIPSKIIKLDFKRGNEKTTWEFMRRLKNEID